MKKKKREGLTEEEEEEAAAATIMKAWDCGSPLYDSYELVSIGHVIDRHLMALPFLVSTSGSSNPIRWLKSLQQASDSSTHVSPSTQEVADSGKAQGYSSSSSSSSSMLVNLWKRIRGRGGSWRMIKKKEHAKSPRK